MFKWVVKEKIINYDRAKTLRDVIKELKTSLITVSDEGIIIDIDDRTDLEKAVKLTKIFQG